MRGTRWFNYLINVKVKRNGFPFKFVGGSLTQEPERQIQKKIINLFM